MSVLSEYGNATLEDLEGSNWAEPAYDSHLVTEGDAAARRKVAAIAERARERVGAEEKAVVRAFEKAMSVFQSTQRKPR